MNSKWTQPICRPMRDMFIRESLCAFQADAYIEPYNGVASIKSFCSFLWETFKEGHPVLMENRFCL